MKIIQLYWRIIENHENHLISYKNHGNHENLGIPNENHENHENLRIP